MHKGCLRGAGLGSLVLSGLSVGRFASCVSCLYENNMGRLPSKLGASLFSFLVGLVVGFPLNPLKVKLLTGDLRTAQAISKFDSQVENF